MTAEQKHILILAAALVAGYLLGKHKVTAAARAVGDYNDISAPSDWWTYAGSWQAT